MEALGIDIGGTGIKAARVDTQSGELLTERERFKTPDPSTPEAVVEVIREILAHFQYQGPVGCGFPGVIRSGVVETAANVSKKWIGVRADEMMGQATGLPFTLANDADVAGMAEMRFGVGQGRNGLVIMLTFGTGIGAALFMDGVLVPNVELGHIELDGREAEAWASERARIEEGLGWKQWAKRVSVYLSRLHAYFWPELFIFGGGASKSFEKFGKHLEVPCEVQPAELRNRAGIIGAALLAAKGYES
jgi:polyphosphate glucokinase